MSAKENKKKQSTPIPHSASDSIPYKGVYQNGVIELNNGKFTKSYRIPDLNFKTANDETQARIAEQYSEFLNSFENDVNVEITLYNKTINLEDFQKQVFLPMRSDNLNDHREEYNKMLLEKMAGARNNLFTEKILTVSVPASDIFIANSKFTQIDAMVSETMATMAAIKETVQPLSLVERLDILKSIYQPDDEHSILESRTIDGHYVESFSLENCDKQGITTKDVIAPSALEFLPGMIKIHGFSEKVARSYYVSNYPTWIKGTILTDFSDIPTNMLISVHFVAQDQSSSIKMVRRQSTNISSDIVDAQKKASRSGYSPDLIAPTLVEAKEEANELLEDITKDNSKLFVTTYVFTLFADNEEDLKKFEDQLKIFANKNLISISPLSMQQESGFNTSLPLGDNEITVDRLMTSQTVQAVIPFNVKDIRQKGGMYYGLNASSSNMILYDRTDTVRNVNPCSCILGMPGAGKSFAAKREIINVLLNTEDEVYVIDPDREYGILADEFGGTTVKVANGSKEHINPFDLNIENSDENSGDPVKVKSEFIQTICEIMIGGKYGLSPIEQSIIDRCTSNIYRDYITYLGNTGKKQDVNHAPTLQEFYRELCNQPQVEAMNLALALERYVKGGLDVFSHKTNLDIGNRFIVYDLKEVGAGLTELGLQICLDNIWNKMIDNFYNGKRTWFYIDEFYLMMQKPIAAAYISQIWKRARKWNGLPCAITQNVEDMLKNAEARTVINNSAFVTILGQTPLNRQQLSDMFGISPMEQKYISAAKPGMGLLIINNNVVPMNDDFPKNTRLYKIMTTAADERIAS